LWWRSSGNSEPGRAVADGTPPSVVAAVAQIDNMLEQCFTDTVYVWSNGSADWLQSSV